MSTLLVVHHTTSPALHELLTACLEGSRAEGIEGVDVRTVPALVAGPADVMHCDGIALVTPANIGYMSGALKHFFDQVYYPCIEDTRGLPYALIVHGASDTTGAVRAVVGITTGLGWAAVGHPVTVVGPPDREALQAVRDLTATLAASLMP